MYSKALELSGYTVEKAENGQIALDKVESIHPDIILLDIMMPTMNGIDFMRHYGRGAGAIPIIVLTNVSDDTVKAEAMEVGARIVLVKSDNDPDVMVETVNQVLAGKILQSGSLQDDGSQNKFNLN